MNAPLVFMDTETTGLSLDDDIWEFAAIRRETDGSETETHFFIAHSYERCAKLPLSFRDDHNDRYRDHRALTKNEAAREMYRVLGGYDGSKPHVIGAVPNFDTERIAIALGKAGLRPPWHYHLIDVENLVVGYLQGTLHAALTFGEIAQDEVKRALTLPWNSDELAAAVGVTIDESDRHTALGDARWAMRIYDAVMGSGATAGETDR